MLRPPLWTAPAAPLAEPRDAGALTGGSRRADVLPLAEPRGALAPALSLDASGLCLPVATFPLPLFPLLSVDAESASASIHPVIRAKAQNHTVIRANHSVIHTNYTVICANHSVIYTFGTGSRSRGGRP